MRRSAPPLRPLPTAVLLIVGSFAACSGDKSTGSDPRMPSVTTAAVIEITESTAICGGSVDAEEGKVVTARGVCWNTGPAPTVLDSRTIDGSGTGSFVSQITGLGPGTAYYTRAYAISGSSIVYGDVQAFTTLFVSAPTVTTGEVGEISHTAVQCGGRVVTEGGAPVDLRGVCWSTTPTPTWTGFHTEDGSGLGSFVSAVQGLSAGTKYSVRAYAVSSAGVGYGETRSFTTLADTSGNEVPMLSTAEVTDITLTTAECGGSIAADGGAPVLDRGVCWSTVPGPTVADSRTSDGGGTGDFASSLIGLEAGSTYFVRAFAANGAGIGYGDERTFATVARDTLTVRDVDGNVYQAVKIGDRWWMAENLRVTHYRNGDGVPLESNGDAWRRLQKGAHCNYANDPADAAVYGHMYNWHAVNDARGLAPQGWHVPSGAEWQRLFDDLGGRNIAGGLLKETGTTHWNPPNYGATNETGFTGLPGGVRDDRGNFLDRGNYGYWWSSTQDGTMTASCLQLGYDHRAAGAGSLFLGKGAWVRCVRD